MITERIIDIKSTIKAQLVVRGFQEEHKHTLPITFTIAAIKSWEVHTRDIKTAYLQGQKINRELHLQSPVESAQPKLEKIGFLQSKPDPALFLFYIDSQIQGIFLIHVDDFIHIGNKNFEPKISQPLNQNFITGKHADTAFKYVRLNVVQQLNTLEVSQKDYSNSLTIDQIPRSSHQKCSMKKGILRNFTKFTGKHLCQSFFFKKEALTQMFSCEFCEICKSTFFTEQFWATASRYPLLVKTTNFIF